MSTVQNPFSAEVTSVTSAVTNVTLKAFNRLRKGLEPIRDNVASGTPVIVKFKENKNEKFGLVIGMNQEECKLIDCSNGSSRWVHLGDFDAMWTKEAAVIEPDNEEYQKSHEFRKTIVAESRLKGHI